MMNRTYTREGSTDGSSYSDEDSAMPVSKLSYGDDESDSDDVGEAGNLPVGHASLQKDPKRSTGPKANARPPKQAEKKPSFVTMIVEAITEINDKRGASVPAIKIKMKENYEISETVMKANFKKAVMKGIENNALLRPAASQEKKGVTGRFKVNPEFLAGAKKAKKLKEKKEDLKKEVNKSARQKSTTKVDREALSSLKEKSLTVKVAKEKIKQARRSIGLVSTVKPRAAPRKLAANPRSKRGKKPAELSSAAESGPGPAKRSNARKKPAKLEAETADKQKRKPRAVNAEKGASKGPAKKAVPAKSKVAKAK